MNLAAKAARGTGEAIGQSGRVEEKKLNTALSDVLGDLRLPEKNATELTVGLQDILRVKRGDNAEGRLRFGTGSILKQAREVLDGAVKRSAITNKETAESYVAGLADHQLMGLIRSVDDKVTTHRITRRADVDMATMILPGPEWEAPRTGHDPTAVRLRR